MATATSDLAQAPGWTVEYADLIGKPFQMGGRGPDAFDCYGLLMELSKRAGRPMPAYASPKLMSETALVAAAKTPLWTPCVEGPGALVGLRIANRTMSHVGLVLPYDKFIHVWDKSGGVCVERLSAWKHRIAGFYRHD